MPDKLTKGSKGRRALVREETVYGEIQLSRPTTRRDMLSQIGDYGPTQRADLFSNAMPAMTRSRDPLRHRTRFIQHLINKQTQNKLPSYNSSQSVKQTDPKQASISLSEFLGEEDANLYKKALEEERNSPEYLRAVLHASTKHYPGKKWETAPVIIVGGPSASGKSVARDAAVEEASMFLPTTHDNRGNDVISIDGGIIREVSQMRKLVIRLAEQQGYTGITDLHTQSHVLEAVKDELLDIAFNTDLGIAIPDTFSDFFNFINPFNNRIARLLNKIKESANVKTPIFTRVVGKDSASFQNAVAFVGESRAWQTSDKQGSSFDDIDLNRTDDLPESKAYGAGGFRFGQFGSWLTEGWFKRNFPKNLRMRITNDLILKKEEPIGSGHWIDANTREEGVICVSDSFYQLWDGLIKYADGLEGSSDNSISIKDISLEDFYKNIKNYTLLNGSALNSIIRSTKKDEIPEEIRRLHSFITSDQENWRRLGKFNEFMRRIVSPRMQTAGQNQLLKAIELINQRIIDLEGQALGQDDRQIRADRLKTLKTKLMAVARQDATKDEVEQQILPALQNNLEHVKKSGKTRNALAATEKALNTILDELPASSRPTMFRNMLSTVSSFFTINQPTEATPRRRQMPSNRESTPLLVEEISGDSSSSETDVKDISSDSSGSETDENPSILKGNSERERALKRGKRQMVPLSSDDDISPTAARTGSKAASHDVNSFFPSDENQDDSDGFSTSSMQSSKVNSDAELETPKNRAPSSQLYHPMDLAELNKQFRQLQEINPMALVDEQTLDTLRRLQRSNVHDWLSPAFGAKARTDAQTLRSACERLDLIDDIITVLKAHQQDLENLQIALQKRLEESHYSPTRFHGRLTRDLEKELVKVSKVLIFYEKAQKTKNNLASVLEKALKAEDHSIIGFSSNTTVHVRKPVTVDDSARVLEKPIKEKPEIDEEKDPSMNFNTKEMVEQAWFETEDPLEEDEVRIFDVTYTEKHEGMEGKYQSRFTEEVREAEETVKSDNPSLKLTAVKFPELVTRRRNLQSEQRAKMEYAMLMASQLLANLNSPPNKKQPIVLRGGNEEQLKYLWTALMVMGRDTPYMKFDADAIVVRSIYFDPEKEKGIIGRFSNKSLYNRVFKQNEADYKKILNDTAKMTRAKLGHEPNLDRANLALQGLFKQKQFVPLIEASTSSEDKPRRPPSPSQGSDSEDY